MVAEAARRIRAATVRLAPTRLLRRQRRILATEKAPAAWENAKARIGAGGDRRSQGVRLAALEAVGERAGLLVLRDTVGSPPLAPGELESIRRLLAPLGYRGVEVLVATSSRDRGVAG